MKKRLLLSLLILPLTCYADIDIQKLQQLIDTGNSTQAYDYASSERANYEGDPVFDYYYGIAAIDSGNASEGVFALERVVLIQAENHAARLELARGYFILEEYARSRQEFETVLGFQPPPTVRARIDNYLSVIRLREGRYNTTTNSFVELGLGNDSNVNSGPESANAFSQYLGFDPIFGTTSVSASSVKQDDSFYDLTANFNIQSPVATGYSLLGSVTGNLRTHSNASEFDTSTLTAKGGLQILQGNNTYLANLTLQKFNLDGASYRDLIGINTTWKRKLTQQLTVNAALQYATSDFDGQPFRNASTTTLSGGLSNSFQTTLNPVVYINLYLANDSADENSANARAKTERDYFGMRLGTVLSTSARTSTHLSLSYQQSEYGGLDNSLTIPLVREDDYLNLLVDVNWLIQKRWKLIAQLSSTRNSSTLDTGDYTRNQLTVTARYDFQ